MLNVAYILFFIYIFFYLISNTVNIDRYKSHEQKFFGILSHFEGCKEALRPKYLGKDFYQKHSGLFNGHALKYLTPEYTVLESRDY